MASLIVRYTTEDRMNNVSPLGKLKTADTYNVVN